MTPTVRAGTLLSDIRRVVGRALPSDQAISRTSAIVFGPAYTGAAAASDPLLALLYLHTAIWLVRRELSDRVDLARRRPLAVFMKDKIAEFGFGNYSRMARVVSCFRVDSVVVVVAAAAAAVAAAAAAAAAAVLEASP